MKIEINIQWYNQKDISDEHLQIIDDVTKEYVFWQIIDGYVEGSLMQSVHDMNNITYEYSGYWKTTIDRREFKDKE